MTKEYLTKEYQKIMYINSTESVNLVYTKCLRSAQSV